MAVAAAACSPKPKPAAALDADTRARYVASGSRPESLRWNAPYVVELPATGRRHHRDVHGARGRRPAFTTVPADCEIQLGAELQAWIHRVSSPGGTGFTAGEHFLAFVGDTTTT